MNDPSLNDLLKWGIKNSQASAGDNEQATDGAGVKDPSRGLNKEALAQLLGGPSDADRMREAMAAIQSPQVDLENKLVAFDNFEQLVENIDNANNMESIGLWMPLVEQLTNEDGQLRLMAAWCVATAVQNNPRAQDRCLVVGAIPKLVKMALEDESLPTRKKAIYALSSEVRNYQPGLNELLSALPADCQREGGYDAADMEAVDSLMTKLREKVQQAS